MLKWEIARFAASLCAKRAPVLAKTAATFPDGDIVAKLAFRAMGQTVTHADLLAL